MREGSDAESILTSQLLNQSQEGLNGVVGF